MTGVGTLVNQAAVTSSLGKKETDPEAGNSRREKFTSFFNKYNVFKKEGRDNLVTKIKVSTPSVEEFTKKVKEAAPGVIGGAAVMAALKYTAVASIAGGAGWMVAIPAAVVGAGYVGLEHFNNVNGKRKEYLEELRQSSAEVYNIDPKDVKFSLSERYLHGDYFTKESLNESFSGSNGKGMVLKFIFGAVSGLLGGLTINSIIPSAHASVAMDIAQEKLSNIKTIPTLTTLSEVKKIADANKEIAGTLHTEDGTPVSFDPAPETSYDSTKLLVEKLAITDSGVLNALNDLESGEDWAKENAALKLMYSADGFDATDETRKAAFDLMSEAAANGHESSMTNQAFMLYNGIGCDKDKDAALAIIEKTGRTWNGACHLLPSCKDVIDSLPETTQIAIEEQIEDVQFIDRGDDGINLDEPAPEIVYNDPINYNLKMAFDGSNNTGFSFVPLTESDYDVIGANDTSYGNGVYGNENPNVAKFEIRF